MHGPIARSGRGAALIVPYLRVLLPGLMAVGAFVLLVEMASFVTIGAEQGKSFKLGGATHIDPFTLPPWLAAAAALVVAIVWLRLEARALGRVWDGLSDEARRLGHAS
jgi:branched-chain amino acid transport system permease protein